MNSFPQKVILTTVFVLILLAGGSYLLDQVGLPVLRFGQSNDRTVTVTGYAKTEQNTQVASFYVGVNAVGTDKEKTINEVNTKIEGVIKASKDFGIKDEDIKTQNLSVYQQEEPYWDGGTQKTRKGEWRVDNTVSIILHDVTRATDLSAVLFKTGANSVSGPNFTLDNTTNTENGLIEEAINNAKDKATEIARASGRKVGKVVRVDEAGVSSMIPMYDRAMGAGGGGSPIVPGTQTVTKQLIVTFELK